MTTARVRSSMARSNAATTGVVIAAVADVEQVEVDPVPVAHDEQRPEPAGVLVAGGDGPVAGPPVDAVDGRVHAVGRAVVDGHVVEVGGDHGGGRRAQLVEPLQRTP